MRALAADGRGRWWAAALGVGLCALAPGCKQASRAPLVDKLGVELAGVAWSEAEARKRFSEALFAAGGFRQLPEKASRPKAPVWNLALFVQVAEPDEGAEAGEAVAVGRLELESDQGVEQEVVVTAVEKVGGPGLDEWREASSGAAQSALTGAVKGARAVVAALGKSDAELLAQLGDPDPQAAEWAAAVLAERKHPGALEPLVALLGTDDLMKSRWAMRFLIRLGDARAASAMIEASRHKDDTFQREIVFALGELGGEEAEAYLFTVAQGHDLPLMRQSAERALSELRARRSRDGGVK